jgi:hypothetical protein
MSITSAGSPSFDIYNPYGYRRVADRAELAQLSAAERRLVETGEGVHQAFITDVVAKDENLRRLYETHWNFDGKFSHDEALAAGEKLGDYARQRGLKSPAIKAAGNSPSKLLEIAKNIDGKYTYEEVLVASDRFGEVEAKATQEGGRREGLSLGIHAYIAFLEQLTPEQLNREEYGFKGALEASRAFAILEDKLEARVRAGKFTYGDQNPKDGEARLILSLYRQIGVDGTAAGYARSKTAVQAVNRYAREGYSAGLHREIAASLKPYGIPFEPFYVAPRPQDQVTLSSEALARLAREAEALKPA